MGEWPIPADEPGRLKALKSYAILDSQSDESFDRITRLASQMLGLPIALISLVDDDRQWFLSRVGIDVCETGRDVAFCAHAICGDEVFVVPDASRDERFRANPLVTGPPQIRFYAGAPLRSHDGHNIGTLCVIGTEPRELSGQERQLLQELAGLAMHQIEQRRRTYLCPLTGLPNRRPFFEAGEREFHRSRRQLTSLSVLLFDIDHFRSISEGFSREHADRVLLQVARVIAAKLRRTDLLARVAGDEFAVLLPASELGGAKTVADTIRREIVATGFRIEASLYPLTVSVGVAELADGDSGFSDLFQRANEALTRAKLAGRNRIVCSSKPSAPV
jgi:diguanylate cyclase (GGDEF)-like protein